MTDQRDLESRVERLEQEVVALRAAYAQLQSSSTQLVPPGSLQPQPQFPLGEPPEMLSDSVRETMPQYPPAPFASPQVGGGISVAGSRPFRWDKIREEGLENIIGGRLLNRLGIIILIIAVGFFLQYSFENNWIGPAGRVAIGYLAGILFLFFGDRLMEKGYHYFSQGFSGGGIAIIYVATFFAVSHYHLMDRMVGFAIMAATAAAGGLLSVRQNAFGVGLISTLGGFMAPFLIGPAGPNTVALLSYVAILDLGVLYLARHQNWRSLNLLAFFSTLLVYVAYRTSLPYDVIQSETGIFQLYNTLYFIIFGALAFYYNVRHEESTRALDIALLTLNALVFYANSYENMDAYFHYLLGPLAIILAVLYLAVALLLRRRDRGDALLNTVLLGTGLVFVTLAIPLQFNQEWVYPAWVAEAAIVIYAAARAGHFGLRTVGLAFLIIITMIGFEDVPYHQYIAGRRLWPVFNWYFLFMFMAVASLYGAAWLYQKGEHIRKGEKWLVWPLAAMGAFYSLFLLTTEIKYALYYADSRLTPDFAVSTGWVLLAVAIMVVGVMRRQPGIRYMALTLFGITTAKVMLLDLSALDLALRVVILLIIGAILVGVSFIYQHKTKEGHIHADNS